MQVNHVNKNETALKYMQVELSWFWTKAKIISKFRDPLMMGKTNLHFSATYARPDLSIMWRVNPAAVLGYIASLKATLVCLFLLLFSWVISISRLIHLHFFFILFLYIILYAWLWLRRIMNYFWVINAPFEIIGWITQCH